MIWAASMGNACFAGGELPQHDPPQQPSLPPPPGAARDAPHAGHAPAPDPRVTQAVGRMDLASPLSDPQAHPTLNPTLHPASAYTPTERLLARLEALSLVPPTCQAQHEAMYRRGTCHVTHVS